MGIHRIKAWDRVVKMLLTLQKEGNEDETIKIEDLLKYMSDISYDEYKNRTDPSGVASILSDFVNAGTESQIDILADEIVKDHRALQQLKFKLFRECIDRWAEMYDIGQYDARNEETCRQSKEISKLLEDSYLPLI